MSKNISSSVPTLTLSSLSDGRFMLRPAGPRQMVLHNPHRDDYYLFGVMLSGEQTISVDFRDITLKAHQAVIVSLGQVHRSVGDAATDGFVIAFPPENMTEAETAKIEEYSLHTLPLILSDDDFDTVKTLYDILLHRMDCSTDVELSIATAIKGIILQQINQDRNIYPDRYLRLTIRLKKLLKENVSAVKSPTEYAAMLNVSGVYLNEAVKHVTGKSANKFIISYAILIAKRELVYTDVSAQEIAYRLGYEDYSYFSRLFRKQTGMSPKAFRQKYLE